MKPFSFDGLLTYDLSSRPSKVFVEDLGRPVDGNCSIDDWLDNLPRQLAANSLRKVRDHWLRVHNDRRIAVAALGGHVIKTGCGPYLVEWMKRGWISAVAMNGSAAIHDFELACAGKTSEDVAAQLPGGQFGMARETADAFAIASRRAGQREIGLGAALGEYIAETGCPHREISVLYSAFTLGIPATVHVAIGTDIVHMHPHVSGSALGEATHLDFRRLCTVVSQMANGLWLNIGSAVLLPEVFLKAVSVVRNFGYSLEGLVTVNIDKESRYRTLMNVLSRPAAEGIEMIGHHEILLPLLHAILAAGCAAQKEKTHRLAA
jgi:hypothetical protein